MKYIKVFVCLSILMLCVSAMADPVKDKLDQLENSIKQMQADSVSRNEKVAAALSTVEQIKQDFASIKGTIEANGHMIQQMQTENDRLRRDMSDRLLAIEERLQIYDVQVSKAVNKVLPQGSNEAESYQKGLDLVHNGDFLTAVSSFRSFLKAYPKSEMASNAQYWIGECYYAMKDYQKSIKEFQAVVDKYPRSDKVWGAQLKQGYCFAELGMADDAKMFLNKVIKDKPNSDEALRAKERLERLEKKEAPAEGGDLAAPRSGGDAYNYPLAPGVEKQKTEAPKENKPQEK